ncbi:ABC-three component system middle component 5 [Rhizobium ruizarguesonis]|jgi:hypothetical protein|uniref:Uncharacterized protein n=1 Tax=Rhizobium ruizarguesonis TaxID=2081791 RepID=A0AAE8U449_9HYPH|nr:ABC-three component system middle component 5 [Rhizobium ruizarguesonis]MCB2400428.1 hypothetical protein [Rhizobium ruizarguesonis]NEI48614.1 hypothetical protein [Rhizobium ruizarguesonis]TAU00342.1 hypothetical protein ELI53_12875 [Rhizobium ruizarguesonis]TAX77124.1 hypothetical protein ELI00_13265 [Rhizobium ruizarguesonis]TAZ19677.1 hypothetical protein ELH77_13360 [Rhizobium ruizarguesonis]
MFTISYSAAYDPFHTVFRFASLLLNSPDQSQRFGVLQISDFYLCFPWFLSDVSAPRSVSGFQKNRNELVRRYKANSYDLTPTASTLFERMEPIQLAALSAMLSKKIVEENESQGTIRILPSMLSQRLRKSIEQHTLDNRELVSFLSAELPKIPLAGKDGLKYRTGLKEYRYDYV